MLSPESPIQQFLFALISGSMAILDDLKVFQLPQPPGEAEAAVGLGEGASRVVGEEDEVEGGESQEGEERSGRRRRRGQHAHTVIEGFFGIRGIIVLTGSLLPYRSLKRSSPPQARRRRPFYQIDAPVNIRSSLFSWKSYAPC